MSTSMNDAELVKSRLDIVEVIAGYVELKKAGKDFRGSSPFRQERTPSFYVSPDKQIWHDFGDNEGGDVISFVMRMEGMTFIEALEMLASRAGVKLSGRRQSGGSGAKQRLYAAVEAAMKFYHLQLSRQPDALAYIKEKRGLTAASIKAYKLGYAPDAWSTLIDHLFSQGYSLAELKQAGLANQAAGKKTGYDLFRDRIMFPVFDAQGRPIGFSGRLLQDSAKAAKYINSPETAIYHKSTAIFGLHQAKPAIRESRHVIIVEGHLDVISVAQEGYAQVVGVSGTALTREQLVLLSRQAEVIQFCFDADAAGEKATARAITLGLNLPVRLEVIELKNGKDPDEAVKTDPKQWRAAVQEARYALDYLLSAQVAAVDPGSAPGKKQLVRNFLPVVGLLEDPVEQEHYLGQLASIVGVPPDTLREKVKEVEKGNPKVNNSRTQPVPSAKKAPSRQEQLESLLLELLLAYPATRIALADVATEDISAGNQPIVETLKKRPNITLPQLKKVLPDLAEHVSILTLRGEHEYSALTEHEQGLEAFTQVHTVQKHIYSLKKRALSRRIAAAEQAGNTSEASDLLRHYQALVSRENEIL